MALIRFLYKTILFFISTTFFAALTIVFIIITLPFGLRHRITSNVGHWWCKSVLFIFNVKVSLIGDIEEHKGGMFFISNHLSYLDIMILYSKFKIIFVSKHDVKYWPLIGLLAMLAGTIFIDRSSTAKTKKYINSIKSVLKKNINILLFPEGTSSSGETILPFKTSLFQAPLESKALIQTVYLDYAVINGQMNNEELRNKVCWYGDMNFAGHIGNFLTLKSVQVNIHPGTIIDTSKLSIDSKSRKSLSNSCFSMMKSLKDNA